MKPTTRSLIKYRGEECLNCGTPLDEEDKYCHQCGQRNTNKKLALTDFINEFFANIFSYDSRVWRTVTQLLFKPGFVSKQFINGKRLHYANPFRFFLSVSIVFFLMLQIEDFVNMFTDDPNYNIIRELAKENPDIDVDNGIFKIQLDSKDKDSLADDQITDTNIIDQENDSIADQLKKSQDKPDENDSLLSKPKIAKHSYTPVSQKELDSLGFIKGLILQIDYYQSFYTVEKIDIPEEALVKMKHDISRYNIALYSKVITLDKIGNDPSLLSDIVLPKLPVFLFLFTPFLTLFLWLLYARSNFTFMEHLVFAFNTFTFIFLSLIVLYLLGWISFGYIDLIDIYFLTYGPFYFYKSMRNFYNQKRFKTIIKYILINFTFVVGLTLGISILTLIGILIY
jgi:hypothetical protein